MMATQSSQVSQLSPEDVKDLVNDTIVYILTHEHTKHAVKRQDIVKNVLKTQSKAFKFVMEQVTSELLDVFGIKLVELDGANKQYILVNTVHNTEEYHLSLPREVRRQQVLLTLALSYIFMQGGTVKEVNMFQFFHQLGIYSDTKNGYHHYFGDIHKLMTKDLVGQLYLEYHRIPDSDPPVHQFSMGKRAMEEVPRRKLLEFVSKMHGCSPEIWLTQLQEVQRKEKKKPESR